LSMRRAMFRHLGYMECPVELYMATYLTNKGGSPG